MYDIVNKKNYFFYATITIGYLNRGKIDYFLKSACELIFYTNIKESIKSNLFSLALKIPYFRNKVEERLLPIKQEIKREINLTQMNYQPRFYLNKHGDDINIITNNLETMKNLDLKKYSDNKLSGTLYNIPDDNELKILKRCMDFYYKTNPLHADIYPSLISMEKDLVVITKNLLNCPINYGKGTLTTGGTESIILALFGYREWARKCKNITSPEVVAPITVHPAFDKGCYYLGIKLKKINVDANNNLDKTQLMLSINHNTILLVGSAPSFPHGLMDDFKLLSSYAKKYRLPLHVDACLGGYVLAFLDIKYKDTDHAWDFRNESVTSISIDTHKYGCCPKSSSLLIFKEEEMFECCYFIQNSWPGGIYATTNITGSRSGLSVAWSWSMLNSLGYDKLANQGRDISNKVKKIRDSFQNDSDIYVFGKPEVCVVGFGSDTVDIYKVSQKMKEAGWNLNELQNPPSFHLCVTNCHDDNTIEEFIKTLSLTLDIVVKEKTSSVNAGEEIKNDSNSGSIYGTTQRVPDRSLIDRVTVSYLNTLH